MKKSPLAVALLFAGGAACAQSSVTLFGVVDATLAHGSGSVAKRTMLTGSGYSSSRVGFRGVEDLGGGLSASFWLEAGLNIDDGRGVATNTNNQTTGGAVAGIGGGQGLTFNRRSTVSLAGGWGELRLGRDYTPQFHSMGDFDPFGVNGVGTSQIFASVITGVTAVRASNSIGYFLPRGLGGLYGQLQYYMGENPSNVPNKRDGTGVGARIGFAKGPFDVALALSRTEYLAGSVSQNNAAGSYDFGVAKVMAQYEWDRNDGLLPAGSKAKGYLVGALVPVGAGDIRLAYSRYKTDQVAGALSEPTSTKYAVGYVHKLSKRTALYATYARVSNGGGAAQALNGSTTAANASSNGYDFGIRHAF